VGGHATSRDAINAKTYKRKYTRRTQDENRYSRYEHGNNKTKTKKQKHTKETPQRKHTKHKTKNTTPQRHSQSEFIHRLHPHADLPGPSRRPASPSRRSPRPRPLFSRGRPSSALRRVHREGRLNHCPHGHACPRLQLVHKRRQHGHVRPGDDSKGPVLANTACRPPRARILIAVLELFSDLLAAAAAAAPTATATAAATAAAPPAPRRFSPAASRGSGGSVPVPLLLGLAGGGAIPLLPYPLERLDGAVTGAFLLKKCCFCVAGKERKEEKKVK